MDTKILALTFVGLACCIAASSFVEAALLDDKSLENGLGFVNIWLEQELPENTEHEQNLNAVQELVDSFDKTNIFNAAKLLVELAKLEECNDDVLENIRLVINQLKYKWDLSRAESLLKHYARMASMKCKDHILKKFQDLTTQLNNEGVIVPVDEEDLKKSDSIFGSERKALISKILKHQEESIGSGSVSFEKTLAQPCERHNDIMDKFFELYWGLLSIRVDHTLIDEIKRLPNFETVQDRYIVCNKLVSNQ